MHVRIQSTAALALTALRSVNMAVGQLVWDLKGTFDAAPDLTFTNQVCAADASFAAYEPCADIGFGTEVAISGDVAAVASRSNYSPSSVRIYTVPSGGEAPGSWFEDQRIVVDDGSTTVWSGYGIALDGNTLVVSAEEESPADYQNVAAKAFVFVKSGGTWTEQQAISITSLTNCCGITPVALNGDTLVIGNWYGSEVVSVYFRTGVTWSLQKELTANDSVNRDFFGTSVDIDGDTIVVGAPGSNGGNGKAYIFTRSGTVWTQQAILEPDISTIPSAPYVLGFGGSVAVDGDLAVIGSKFNGDYFGYVSFGGSVDIFRGSGSIWTREGPIDNGGLSVDERSYGVSVDVKDGIVLVGVKEMYKESYGNGPAVVWGYGDFDGYPGAYVYEHQGNPPGWVNTARLHGSGKAGFFSDHSVALGVRQDGGYSTVIAANAGTFSLPERDPAIVQGFVNYFDTVLTLPDSNYAVIFGGLNADSTTDITSKSGNSFVVEYLIGRDKTHGVAYYVGDANCIPQEGTNIPFIIEEYVKPNTDPMFDSLRMVFRFNPDDIANSNVYDVAHQEIQICLAVTQTNFLDNPSGTPIVAEDRRLLRIPFLARDWCKMIAMSDDELFNKALMGPLGEYCSVVTGGATTACDYYVTGRPDPDTGFIGIPLTLDGRGTGCVHGGSGSCFFTNADYDLTPEESDAMCTESEIANAAAQLRYGIRNGYCMDDASYFTDCKTPSPTPAPCGNTGTCTINPDPHFNIWDPYVYYDFQGGCDMYAIKNDLIEVQIRTRPRGSYSTITKVAVKIVQTGEVFYLAVGDGVVTNTLGNSGSGLLKSYSVSTDTWCSHHTINLGVTSYVMIDDCESGVSLTASGCGSIFGGAEGMCGSFDNGGAKNADGTPFLLTGDYETDKTNAIALARSWMIDSGDSLFDDPSTTCVSSSRCGGVGDSFACDATRRQLQEVIQGCTKTCADIDAEFRQFREQCEKDIELTGDVTWACAPAYLNPTLSFDRDIPITPGYGRWYVDWKAEHCYQDCEVGIVPSCGGRANTWDTLYVDLADCCSSGVAYKNAKWCEKMSLGRGYAGSGQFYVDFEHSMCVKDCDSGGALSGNNYCGGIVEESWVRLYDNISACCKGELAWQDPDLCVSLSDPLSAGTNKFYDIQQDKKCAQDCNAAGGSPCSGPPDHLSAHLYDTAEECCKAKFPWITLSKCLAATSGTPGSSSGTGEWYVDWEVQKCVKDCVAGANCGGLRETWDLSYTNANDCCANIPWIPHNKCT